MGKEAAQRRIANAGTDRDEFGRPPCVTRGALPNEGVYLLLDWLRMVGPEVIDKTYTGSPECDPFTGEVLDASCSEFDHIDNVERVRQWLRHRFNAIPEGIKGRHCFEAGETYGQGVTLCWGHASGLLMVEFTGSALAQLEASERVEIARTLQDEFGLKATRIDIASDFVGQGLNLFDRALESCDADQLCHARTYDVYTQRRIGSGQQSRFKGSTIYLGQRGKDGSGRLGRVYDKGLEQKVAEAGVWERFEVEFSKETADVVCRAVCAADRPEQVMQEFLLGAFAFRHVTGRRELAKRPLVDWWARLVALVNTRRATVRRTPSELHRYAAWLKKCVVPQVLALSEVAGVDANQLIAVLCGDVEAKDEKPGSVIEAFRLWLTEHPIPESPTDRTSIAA